MRRKLADSQERDKKNWFCFFNVQRIEPSITGFTSGKYIRPASYHQRFDPRLMHRDPESHHSFGSPRNKYRDCEAERYRKQNQNILQCRTWSPNYKATLKIREHVPFMLLIGSTVKLLLMLFYQHDHTLQLQNHWLRVFLNRLLITPYFKSGCCCAWPKIAIRLAIKGAGTVWIYLPHLQGLSCS